MPYAFVAMSMINLPQSVKPAIQPATDLLPAPTTCPLENRLHILESQMPELLKAATAEKSSRDVASLDATPGVAIDSARTHSEALDGSTGYTVLVIIPDISNLYTFIGVETGYIPHYVDIVRFNSKKFINSGHSRI